MIFFRNAICFLSHVLGMAAVVDIIEPEKDAVALA
jgi:hypothetical protein